jgi:hypothetical protein
MASIDEYVAIDPLALMFPSSVYAKIVEMLHPHVPSVAEIAEAAKGMTAEQRSFVLARARILSAYGKAVEEAMKQR